MTQPDDHRPEAKNCSQSVRELHELYCHWTATLSLRFDRERLWHTRPLASITPKVDRI